MAHDTARRPFLPRLCEAAPRLGLAGSDTLRRLRTAYRSGRLTKGEWLAAVYLHGRLIASSEPAQEEADLVALLGELFEAQEIPPTTPHEAE